MKVIRKHGHFVLDQICATPASSLVTPDWASPAFAYSCCYFSIPEGVNGAKIRFDREGEASIDVMPHRGGAMSDVTPKQPITVTTEFEVSGLGTDDAIEPRVYSEPRPRSEHKRPTATTFAGIVVEPCL